MLSRMFRTFRPGEERIPLFQVREAETGNERDHPSLTP